MVPMLRARLLAISAACPLLSCAGTAVMPAAARPTPPPAPGSVVAAVAPPHSPDSGETSARAIAVGLWSTCALLEDGTVWCWGEDHDGTSGEYERWPRQIPLEHVVAIEGAETRMYAVTSRGDLYFWGRGPSGDATIPRRLQQGGVAEVSASSTQTCIRSVAGEVFCWSAHELAQQRIVLPRARQVAVGTGQACALDDSSNVQCWKVAGSPEVRAAEASQVAVAGDLACALVRGGQVRCWGDAGVTGHETESFGTSPERLRASPNGVCALVAGAPPRCVVVKTGNGREDQLPDSRVIAGLAGASELRIGPAHACAITRGAITCWGESIFGALGDPSLRYVENRAKDAVIPVRLGDHSVFRRARAIAVDEHRCLVTTDDELYCWGENALGQLGQGDDVARGGPARVQGIGPVSAVAVAKHSTCAVGKDGSVHCFGFVPGATGFKPCPHGPSLPDPRCAARPVEVLSGAKAVSVGNSHVCALITSGEVRCFGDNSLGQLGDGGKTSSFAPVPVRTSPGHALQDVVELRANGDFTCALERKGEVRCWGKNEPGTQGRPYNSPGVIRYATQPFELGRVTRLSNSCVQLESGELRCWGAGERYRPARVGVCGTRLVAEGPGHCRSDDAGIVTCGEVAALRDKGWIGVNIRANTGPLRALEAAGREACAVDEQGNLSCWRYDSDLLPVIGTVIPELVDADAPTEACPADPPDKTLPKFPPEPFERAYVQRSAPPGREGTESHPEVPITATQATRLVGLLNDPSNFVSATTCHSPHHEYLMKDSELRVVARVEVGLGCTTLQEWPHNPAHRGNIVARKMQHALVALCREVGLDHCEATE